MFGHGTVGSCGILLGDRLRNLAITLCVAPALLFALPGLYLSAKEISARQGHHTGQLRIATELDHEVVEASTLIQIIPSITRDIKLTKVRRGIQKGYASVLAFAILRRKPRRKPRQRLQRFQQFKH